MLIVGIPKEIKALERRVGLTPEGVRRLTSEGTAVWVEAGAGGGSGFSDADYEASGAGIVKDARALYGQTDFIQKVKEPQPEEYPFLKKKHILFCFLHLASPEQCELVRALLEAGLTAIGFETVERDHRLPILAPMSQIAGGLAAAYAAAIRNGPVSWDPPKIDLAAVRRKMEDIGTHFPSVPQSGPIGNVVIFGGGSAGRKAAEIACRLEGRVTLIEPNKTCHESILRELACFAKERLKVQSGGPGLAAELERADVLIGTAHATGKRAVQVVSSSTLAAVSARKKKAIMDVAIDQGGNFPESRPTDYGNPLYFDSFGNVRFDVTNIPSLCGRAASEALAEASLPYTLALTKGLEHAFRRFPELKTAVNIEDGHIRIPAIQAAHQR